MAGWTALAKGAAIAFVLLVAAWLAIGIGRKPLLDGGVVQKAGDLSTPSRTSTSPMLRPAVSRDRSAPTIQGLIVPISGVAPKQLADTFTDSRSEGRRHDAIDIPAPLGTPVLAAARGRVEKLFLSGAGGNTVYVRSPDGRWLYYYAHLDRYAPGLHEGEELQRGDPIGAVGASGNADPSAPHLHFAIMATAPDRKWWEAAEPINPYPLLVR